MHLSLSLWCAILSFTTAQEFSDSTSTSRNAAVPWITYTSTRSCTTQPSTVFVYTSNSTTFLLPQPGSNSAITPLDSNAASSAYDASISAASNGGLATGAEGTTQASSGDSGGFLSATGSEDPPATPTNTTGTAQSTPWATESSAVKPSASSGDSGSFVSTRGSEDSPTSPSNTTGVAQSTPLDTNIIAPTPPASSAGPSTTSRRGLGAGYSAGSGPRSGTQDLSSTLATSTTSVPYLAAPGSTCPLPSTITISATLPDVSCATFEKTVTSYIMASCPVPSGGLETQTVVQSGRTSYITRTRQMTRPILVTHTTIESGTTAYRTSLQESSSTPLPTTLPDGSIIERTVTQSQISTLENRVTEILVLTSLQNGSTIYRTSYLEQIATASPVMPTTGQDGIGSCASVLDRTVTIERTVERTPSPAAIEPSTITFTTIENGSTIYQTSIVRETISKDAIVYTSWEGGSTIFLTSIIPGNPLTVTFSSLQEASTIYRESVIERTAEPVVLTHTEIREASTAYVTSTIQQTPSPITTISTEVLGGSTFYSTSTIFVTPEPIVITYSTTRDGSTVYEVSTIERTPEPRTIISTEFQGGSTAYITTVYTSTPEPLTIVLTEEREGTTIFRFSTAENTLRPVTITYTEVQEASTIYSFSVVESTPEPITYTFTTVQGGSVIYQTAYIDRTPSPEVITQTLIESGQTVFRTSLVERTLEATSGVQPIPTSAFSLAASTIYSCISGSDASMYSPANASVQTITSTMYETMNATECPANLSASTVTSFVYGFDSSSFIGTASISADLITLTLTEGQDGSTVYRTSLIERTATATLTSGNSEFATQTVTSFIYGETILTGNTNELMTMSTKLYEISTVTETSFGNCSVDSNDALTVQTVTSLVYPSSCDFQFTSREAPEITITRRGSTVTVYASRTRTIIAYSTLITTATAPGNASQTDESEPLPDPGEEPPDDEDFPDEDPSTDGDTTASTGATEIAQTGQAPASSIASQPSPSPVVANATDLAQQGTASDPFVVAQVVSPDDSPPIAPPASNSSFLLVTFGSTDASSTTALSTGSGLRRRQASQQPLTYNATAYFSSIAGGVYNLSASAAMGQNGNTPPSCILSICVETMCSPSYPLTTAFSTYTYTYNSPSTASSQAGIFSIKCLGQAYVGLDNVRVDPVFVPQPTPSPASSPIPASPTPSNAGTSSGGSAAAPGASSGPPSSVYTPRSVRTVTTSIFSILTTTAYATQTLTQTESTQAFGTLTTRQVEPTTILTTQFETATSLQNVTVSDVQTLTSR